MRGLEKQNWRKSVRHQGTDLGRKLPEVHRQSTSALRANGKVL